MYYYTFNKSIKNCLEIATRYGYHVEVITICHAPRGRAFLSVSAPAFRSPYPHHFTSNIATYEYCDKMFNKWQEE